MSSQGRKFHGPLGDEESARDRPVRQALGDQARAPLAREFAVGAFAGRARHNRILGISAAKNRFASIVFDRVVRSLVRNTGSHNLIKGNLLSRTPTGIALIDAQHISGWRGT